MAKVVRAQSEKDAASMLRVTPRRLRDMQSSSWWHPDLRTDEGYDVVGIVLANLSVQFSPSSLSYEDMMNLNIEVLNRSIEWARCMVDARTTIDITAVKPNPLDAKAVFEHFMSLVRPELPAASSV